MVEITKPLFTVFVTEHNPKIRKMNNLQDAKQAIKQLGCDQKSIPIMAPKMIHRVVELDNIMLQDAIIIKQDMLSVGGEVAVPKDTFQLQGMPTSILVSGTVQQHQVLVEKLRRHYPRIKRIAEELNVFLESLV